MSNSTKKIELALVIPVFNEAKCLQEVIEEWFTTLSEAKASIAFRFIIVDDGSTDETKAILSKMIQKYGKEQLTVLEQQNAGHGSALLKGYQTAIEQGVTYVFQTDSDNQFYATDFFSLWAERKSSPIILANRLQRNDPKLRLLISKFLQFIIKQYFGVSVKDVNVPFRLLEKNWLKKQMSCLLPSCLAPNIFLSVLGAKQGNDLKNITVRHRKRLTGQSVMVSGRLLRTCMHILLQVFQFNKKMKSGNCK